MQVYKNYGNKDINQNSIIDHKNLYSRSHYESEKIILKNLKNIIVLYNFKIGQCFRLFRKI